MTSDAQRKPVRWWPFWLLLIGCVGAVLLRWGLGLRQRQTMVLFVQCALAVFAIGSLIWFFFLSRLPRATRGAGACILVIFGVSGGLLFEHAGFNGDMMPMLRVRSAKQVVPIERVDAPRGVVKDFSQFRGANRDGRVSDVVLAPNWTQAPPMQVWRRSVGAGWSPFSVAGDIAVTLEQHDEKEVLVAYGVDDGEEMWRVGWNAEFASPVAGTGPRSTPLIHDGRVYAVGGRGHVLCAELDGGKLRWEAELADHGKGERRWGYAASPIVEGDHLICVAGGDDSLLVAFDLESGKVAWKGGSHRHHYSSPVITELAGRRQIVLFARNRLMGLTMEGDLLWDADWPEGSQCVAQPLPLGGDRLMISSGYGVGAAVYEIRPETGSETGFVAEQLWANNKFKAKFASMILHQELVFGLDDGILVCLDPNTGSRIWKKGRYGHGQILLIGEDLLVMAETGHVVLVDPENGAERSRIKVLDRRTWNPPAMAGNRLFVRNEQEAACYLLPLR